MDILDSRFYNKLKKFVPKTSDPLPFEINALMIPWWLNLGWLMPSLEYQSSLNCYTRQIRKWFLLVILTKLPQKNMVRKHTQPSGGGALVSSKQIRLTGQKPPILSCSLVADFNSITLETKVPMERNIPDSVISTLLKARKYNSSKISYQTWKTYFSCMRAES